MDESKVYGLLSLCKKAGRIRSGETALMESIRAGEARLVLIASDASDNTRKKLRDKCDFRQIPWIIFGDREKLGRSVGAGERAGVAVTDDGFAGAITKRLATEKGESNGKDEDF